MGNRAVFKQFLVPEEEIREGMSQDNPQEEAQEFAPAPMQAPGLVSRMAGPRPGGDRASAVEAQYGMPEGTLAHRKTGDSPWLQLTHIGRAIAGARQERTRREVDAWKYGEAQRAAAAEAQAAARKQAMENYKFAIEQGASPEEAQKILGDQAPFAGVHLPDWREKGERESVVAGMKEFVPKAVNTGQVNWDQASGKAPIPGDMVIRAMMEPSILNKLIEASSNKLLPPDAPAQYAADPRGYQPQPLDVTGGEQFRQSQKRFDIGTQSGATLSNEKAMVDYRNAHPSSNSEGGDEFGVRRVMFQLALTNAAKAHGYDPETPAQFRGRPEDFVPMEEAEQLKAQYLSKTPGSPTPAAPPPPAAAPAPAPAAPVDPLQAQMQAEIDKNKKPKGVASVVRR